MTEPKAPQSATAQVRVLCEEVVVPSGTRTISWYVRVNERWVVARQHPSAQSERLPAGPGTVWEEAVSLLLSPGTELKRVTSEPAPKPRALFDYLRREVRGVPRSTNERLYTVGSKGELRELGRPENKR